MATLHDALEVARVYAIDTDVRGRFRDLVIVRGRHDTTMLVFDSAEVVRWHTWVLVFPEHIGSSVYAVDDFDVTVYGPPLPIPRIGDE